MSAYRFKAKLWVWPGGQANWHFITVPKKESETIKSKIKVRRAPTPVFSSHKRALAKQVMKKQVWGRGFGSVKVEAKIGKTKWDTSIFPDSKSGTFLLPVKAKVRREEGIDAGEEISVALEIK